MPEPTPIVTSEGPSEQLDYRPISGLAIVGLALAGFYVVVVLLSAVVAVIKGEPFYLPDWLLCVPIASFILSILAYRHIRKSEDTRAGLYLAQCGFWLSLVSGLGYFTYTQVTGLAVRDQANRFLMEKGADSGFFAMLQSGDEIDRYAAFLLTQSVSDRRPFKPHERDKIEKHFDLAAGPGMPRGKLSGFMDSPLVRLFKQHPKASVESIGLKEWAYEGKGYRVERNYRVTTPEGTFDLLIMARSMEGEPGEGRKWFLQRGSESIVSTKLTTLGKQMLEMRRRAAQFADMWLQKLRLQPLEAYFDTRDPAERKNLRDQYDIQRRQAALLAAVSAVCYAFHPVTSIEAWGPDAAFPPLYGRWGEEIAVLALPEFDTFRDATSYLKLDKIRVDPKLEQTANQTLGAAFNIRRPDLPQVNLRAGTVDYSIWSSPKAGLLEIQLDFEMPLRLQAVAGASTGHQALGKVVVSVPENADPTRPEIFQQFRVVRIDIERVVALPAPGPGE